MFPAHYHIYVLKSTAHAPPMQALGKGPLAITIWADSNPDIQLYSTGVYASPASSSAKEDHVVTLVGYGSDTLASGKVADYWIIKNRQGWQLAAAGCWLGCCSLSGQSVCSSCGAQAS